MFKQIFYEILAQCMSESIIETSEVFVDGTRIRAHANRNKKESVEVLDQAFFIRKSEHKEVFAYSAQVACDKNGWILGYTITSRKPT
ncbi:hypothetical protein A5816_002905 [Enterococcus sp. 3G1_DIV0629]|nr:hypothetical protein A5816_002905 [Enterococcus sp. 3G1_DIV0629]